MCVCGGLNATAHLGKGLPTWCREALPKAYDAPAEHSLAPNISAAVNRTTALGHSMPQTFLLEELKERAIELLPARTPEQRATLLQGRRREEEAAR